MSKPQVASVLLLLAPWAFCQGPAPHATAPHAPAPLPPTPLRAMEVELVEPLNSAKLKTGDEVLGKLRENWTDGSCRLPLGSVVHGLVHTLSPAGARAASVELDFEYACREEAPHKLTWLALLAPAAEPLDPSGHAVARALFRSSSFGEGSGLGSAGNTQGNPTDMSGRQNATLPMSFESADEERASKRPESIRTGEVWHLPRLKLEVGNGVEGGTLLRTPDRQVKLPRGAILVLLPEATAVVGANATSSPRVRVAAAATPAKAASAPLPPEIGRCLRSSCMATADATALALLQPAAQGTLALAALGYRRLKSAEMHELEYGAAVAFLGEDELLFTFDPHVLVPRASTDRPEDHPHIVRAVLFNLHSGLVLRTLDWRVRDGGQYLWPLDGEHVMVADGGWLRRYGKGLIEERSVKLDGPLLYLHLAPDGDHAIAGVLHELHTVRDHADLVKLDAAAPEEQVEMQVLDHDLHTLTVGASTTRALPPLTLNDGWAELRRLRGNEFYLRETAWAGGAPRSFARMRSSCVPQLEGVGVDMLLAEGCEGATTDHWYRVFHAAGPTVLEGVLHRSELSPLPASGRDGALFALTTVEAGGDYLREHGFHGSELVHERVSVYRANDGHGVAQVHLHEALPARQPMAFSPAGDQVAVIDGETIRLYKVSAAP